MPVPSIQFVRWDLLCKVDVAFGVSTNGWCDGNVRLHTILFSALHNFQVSSSLAVMLCLFSFLLVGENVVLVAVDAGVYESFGNWPVTENGRSSRLSGTVS